jgi:putative membrane protein
MKNNRVLYVLVAVYALLQGLIFVTKTGVVALPDGVFPAPLVLILTSIAFVHGIQRYGWKNMMAFFGITLVVSFSLESLSIATGFPFGHYHYSDGLGIKLGTVPLLIIPAYFSFGYLAWTLASGLTLNFGRKLERSAVFLVPLVAAFAMVMWDLTMDPVSATIQQRWIWEQGGAYMGVPYSNFLGWYLTVFLIFQIFAFIVHSSRHPRLKTKDGPSTWYTAVIVYALTALQTVVTPLVTRGNPEIYQNMSLVALFTMMFISVLTFILVRKDVRYPRSSPHRAP